VEGGREFSGRYLLGLFLYGGLALFLWSQPTALCTAKRREMGGRTVFVAEAMAMCAWSSTLAVVMRARWAPQLARQADLIWRDCVNQVSGFRDVALLSDRQSF
jgi:hypothetical protein